jgi:RNA polymerase sigma-70 factor (ECF subfamily)
MADYSHEAKILIHPVDGCESFMSNLRTLPGGVLKNGLRPYEEENEEIPSASYEIVGEKILLTIIKKPWKDDRSSHHDYPFTMDQADPLDKLSAVYRSDSRRVLATLVRLLGDLDLAEEALHEAFAAAVQKWPKDGVPENPQAWLVSAGRFRAIDLFRRQSRMEILVPELARELESKVYEVSQADLSDSASQEVEDDRLRLIFLCCHPVNPQDAQVALTLREVCGLTTEEIAEAYMIEVDALAKRIVRAKSRIRDKRIPYEIPPLAELASRLDSVLKVVYLVFNEGYSASSGASLLRSDLSAEAIRLGRLLVELLPEAEDVGLLALMLLQESRQAARESADGDLLLLDEQDRFLWNQDLIKEGVALVERALSSRRFGPYSLQAAIAAIHAQAPSFADTDWEQIVLLYDVLIRATPSPVIELNRAVAVSMRDGPDVGLALVENILDRGDLADYHLAYSFRADLCRRLGRIDEARDSYERALSLARQEPERRFLRRRLAELPETS